jgi:putative transcriptional regulator
MKNQLSVHNLMATYYENGNHVLEFDLNGQIILVTVRGVGPVNDEYYWDDQTTLASALAKVEADDIVFQDPSVRALRACADMTQKEFAEFTEIPQRTIEGWESGRRQPPTYVVQLIAQMIKHQFLFLS